MSDEVKLDFDTLKPVEDPLDSVQTTAELEPWISNIGSFLDDALMSAPAGVVGDSERTLRDNFLGFLHLPRDVDDQKIVEALIKEIREEMLYSDGPLPVFEFRDGLFNWCLYGAAHRTLNDRGRAERELWI